MNESTVSVILTLLNADGTLEHAHREAIEKAIVEPPKEAKQGPLIDGNQAAQILGCCKRTVFRMAKAGRIQRIKHGERRVRFDRDAIIEFRNRGIEGE